MNTFALQLEKRKRKRSSVLDLRRKDLYKTTTYMVMAHCDSSA
jgi:hypothetical protein